jgi:hypothetical protein
MLLQFRHQILIGNHVHGVGEVIEIPDGAARDLIARGVAVERFTPDHLVAARKATAAEPARARKAVRSDV